MLHTYDVFDTVMVRAVGSPETVFLLVGRRLQRAGVLKQTPEVFARARIESEGRALRNHGGLDCHVSLSRIYAELAWALGLDAETTLKCLAAELDCERALVRYPKRSAALIEGSRKEAAGIAFVSDTCLSTDQVRSMLDFVGVIKPDDPLFVSSEFGLSKRSGRIFELVRHRLGVASREVHHTGNDYHSDFLSPRRHGFSATHFSEGNLNRYEAILEGYRWQTGGLSSAFAGASRLTRLGVCAETAQREVLRNLAGSIGGPLVAGLALWALVQARAAGLRRVYFAARDGQIVWQVARILAKKLQWDLDLRYLFCSRQAWVSPAIGSNTSDLLDLILSSRDVPVSVRAGLARLDLAPEELREELSAAGFPAAAWDEILDENRADALRRLLREHSGMFSLICRRAEEKREIVLDYLRQEGLLDGERFALFDLGQRLTLLRALDGLLPHTATPPPLGLYLLRSEAALEPDRASVATFLFDAKERIGHLDKWNFVTLLEFIFSADHGTVCGYRREGKFVHAVLKEDSAARVLAWDYEYYRNIVLHFANELFLDSDLVDVEADLRGPLLAVAQRFWCRPTRREAEMVGRFPFEDGWGVNSKVVAVTKPFGWLDTLGTFRRKGLKSRYRHDWVEGSIAVSPGVIRGVFFARFVTGRLAGIAWRLARRALRRA